MRARGALRRARWLLFVVTRGGPAVAEDHFQFERVGFFVVDKDSYAGADRRGPIVFNRVCSLREAKATKAAKSGGGAQA